MKTLLQALAEHTTESALAEPIDGYRIRCLACGLRCPIPAGFSGVCKVRFNRAGKLYVPQGYVSSLQCDPIEKKPFFHVRPGSLAMSFGMLGCDLHCGYCQNWVTSQALRDVRASIHFADITADQLVRTALQHGATAMVSTYNEPLITAEWAAEVFAVARKAGLLTGFVSNGNATPEVLRYLRPNLDIFKIDLKSFNDRSYRQLGGRLAPILDAIAQVHDMGFWLEIVTLLVPGFNDSGEELSAAARFIAGVSPDIPWHITAFHPDYKMTAPKPTPPSSLIRAASIGYDAGLRFVYAGNLPGEVGRLEDTHCPRCSVTLIRRRGHRVLEHRITRHRACPDCGAAIPGVWGPPPKTTISPIPLVHRQCG